MQTHPGPLYRPVPAFLRQPRPAGGPSSEDESPVDRLIRQGSLEGRTTPTEIGSLKGQPREKSWLIIGNFYDFWIKKIEEVFEKLQQESLTNLMILSL
jgi:hypothetical protein